MTQIIPYMLANGEWIALLAIALTTLGNLGYTIYHTGRLVNKFEGVEINVTTVKNDVGVIKEDIAILKVDVAILKNDVVKLEQRFEKFECKVERKFELVDERFNRLEVIVRKNKTGG